ncbi:Protein priA [Hypsizygus marmoreus]|uniref:Protein priA n=1 Tax=Hypsizygus marmoreus TaxID=39966 RepID=A0A369JYA2_HYPMA|nr:Protein priA [Hypsizygus marmoreus]
MRLHSLAIFFCTLLLPSVIAIQYFPPSAKKGGRSSLRRSLAQLQYRIRRDTTDTCVSITGQQFAEALGIPDPESYADLTVCTCQGDYSTWLTTDPNGIELADRLGETEAASYLAELFDTGGGGATVCTLPTSADRVCSVGDPCAFACQPNYTEQDGACVCLDPFIECNGVCDVFPGGCSSATPRKKRSLPVASLAQAKATCKPTESVCGIAGRENTFDFECVDTSSTLDSCGGCITPHPFYEPYRSAIKGVECGRLAGIISVGCSDSRCVVSGCRDGHEPSFDKRTCVPIAPISQQLVMGVGGPRLAN